jgi:glycosidase
MKKLYFLFLLLLLFAYCKKENTHPPIIPPPDDTTSFSVPLTKDIVMYEVNLRAYSQSGDLQGVTNRLDEIKALGVNVIWLMPIYPIGQIKTVNSPYCVKNYEEVNPEFGTLTDLQNLVKESHKRNIAVILDWVANHTAWDNPWIANTDWYTQDGQGNIISPAGTNWQDVADLNYDSQPMRLAMIDAMEYWVKNADIDGYRCDAADWIPFDFWQQALDSVSGTKDSLIWLAEGARADHFTAGFQMNYSWDFYDRLVAVYGGTSPAASLVLVNNQEYFNMPAGAEKLRFTTNHDKSAWESTPMVLFNGEQGALAASVAAICLGGVPLIYGSQEVGQQQLVPFFSHQPINWTQHPEMLQAYQDLIGFYNDSKAAKSGTLKSYSTLDVLAFMKVYDQDTIMVIDNLRNSAITYNLHADLQNTIWKNALDSSNVSLSTSLSLAAYQYLILKK